MLLFYVKSKRGNLFSYSVMQVFVDEFNPLSCSCDIFFLDMSGFVKRNLSFQFLREKTCKTRAKIRHVIAP